MIGMKSSLLLALAVVAHNMSLAAMETDALRESKEIEARVAALAARYGLSVEEVSLLLKNRHGDIDALEAFLARAMGDPHGEADFEGLELRQMAHLLAEHPKLKEPSWTGAHDAARAVELDLRPPRRDGVPWQLRKAGKRGRR